MHKKVIELTIVSCLSPWRPDKFRSDKASIECFASAKHKPWRVIRKSPPWCAQLEGFESYPQTRYANTVKGTLTVDGTAD
jgi:hypothetical protein